jgi:hypothetical protein
MRVLLNYSTMMTRGMCRNGTSMAHFRRVQYGAKDRLAANARQSGCDGRADGSLEDETGLYSDAAAYSMPSRSSSAVASRLLPTPSLR